MCFKGGTSLSKCYPGSIERFSEDIDLTFLGMDLSDKCCNKHLKSIEKLLTDGLNSSPINEKRNKRNKSCYIWKDNETEKILLEMGSSVRPDPYTKLSFKSYIHEYLEQVNPEYVEKFNFKEVTLNVLSIERTFIDKVMAVKRHAMNGTLINKVRHIYDVKRLFNLKEIQNFINNKEKFKEIVKNTKETDSIYLSQKGCNLYNSLEAYNFNSFKHLFDKKIKERYESLHKDLLYTNEKQLLDEAIAVFEQISKRFEKIGE